MVAQTVQDEPLFPMILKQNKSSLSHGTRFFIVGETTMEEEEKKGKLDIGIYAANDAHYSSAFNRYRNDTLRYRSTQEITPS